MLSSVNLKDIITFVSNKRYFKQVVKFQWYMEGVLEKRAHTHTHKKNDYKQAIILVRRNTNNQNKNS